MGLMIMTKQSSKSENTSVFLMGKIGEQEKRTDPLTHKAPLLDNPDYFLYQIFHNKIGWILDKLDNKDLTDTEKTQLIELLKFQIHKANYDREKAKHISNLSEIGQGAYLVGEYDQRLLELGGIIDNSD